MPKQKNGKAKKKPKAVNINPHLYSKVLPEKLTLPINPYTQSDDDSVLWGKLTNQLNRGSSALGIRPITLKVKDLFDFVLWCFCETLPTPAWLNLAGKYPQMKINKMVVLNVPFLNQNMFHANQNKLLSLRKIFPTILSLVAPGSSGSIFSTPLHFFVQPSKAFYKIFPFLSAKYYITNLSKESVMSQIMKEKETEKETEKEENDTKRMRLSVQDYDFEMFLLSKRQLVDNGFPSLKTDPNFVETKPLRNFIPIVGMDCEMVRTTEGLELARVTAVDPTGKVIYDKLVKPQNVITDYVTLYSGITEEILRDVKTTLADVQKDLLVMIGSQTILVGHSLENDLIALKMVHSRVVDTSVLFVNPTNPNYKSKLSYLAHKYLSTVIQNSSDGHNSAEDAYTSLTLAIKFVKGEIEMADFNKNTTNLVDALRVLNVSSTIIDTEKHSQQYRTSNFVPAQLWERLSTKAAEPICVPISTPTDSVSSLISAIQKHPSQFIWANMNYQDNFDLALFETQIETISSVLPNRSIFILILGDTYEQCMTTRKMEGLTSQQIDQQRNLQVAFTLIERT